MPDPRKDAEGIRDALHEVEAKLADAQKAIDTLHRRLSRALYRYGSTVGIEQPGEVHTDAGGTGKTAPS
jgi:hypothetical protein